MMDYSKLYEFCTVKQLEVLQAYEKHGSYSKTAKAIGRSKTAVQESVCNVKKKAALRGWSPEHDLTRTVAPGQMLRGASTLYRRGEPEPVLQWVKTSADQAAIEAIKAAAIEAMCE